MKLSHSLVLTLPLVSGWAMAADLSVKFDLPQLNVAEYHKPYVAIWLERADQSVAANLAVLYDLKKDYECVELTSPPELFNYIDIERIKIKLQGSREILVIYNDPPLGTEELNVLNDIDTKIHFTTPSHLFNFYQNGK